MEGCAKAEVARDHGLSRRRVTTLVQRHLAEGGVGLRPRFRRPYTSPTRTAEDEIVAIREDLDRHGHESGAATIAAHPERRHGTSPAIATIWRILTPRVRVPPDLVCLQWSEAGPHRRSQRLRRSPAFR